jgi:hypothetical protein
LTGRFAGFAAGFFAAGFAGWAFFKGRAAAARTAGLRAFFGGVFAAGFFPARLGAFLVTVFVAKVFSFGRSASTSLGGAQTRQAARETPARDSGFAERLDAP